MAAGTIPQPAPPGLNHSGDPDFKKEYDRLTGDGRQSTSDRGTDSPPARRALWPPIDYEKSVGGWYLANMADCVTMDVMELDYLLRNDPENAWAADLETVGRSRCGTRLTDPRPGWKNICQCPDRF